MMQQAPSVLHRPVAAVTLVEVMVAVALSTVVLLLAFTAFRVAAQSISHLNRLTTENDLMRQGIVQAVDDADFWNTEANPEFPYGRAYAAYRNVDALGNRQPDNAATVNHGNNKRPFRRVEYVTGSAEDPNWLLPHDPRSWYRNMVYSNARPIQTDYLTGRLWRASGHPSTNWQMGRTGFGSISVHAWWTPRHIWGDYAEVANVAEIVTPSAPMATPAVETEYRGALPALMQGLFREIGVVGVAGYLPQGVMTTYLRPSTNLYNGLDASTQYDKGEIPWQLDRPKILNQDGNENSVIEANAGKWNTVVTRPTAAEVPDQNRLNYMEALQFWHGLTVRDFAAANRMRGLLYGVRVGDGAWPWAVVNTSARQGWSRDFLQDIAGYASTTTLVSWAASDEAQAHRNDTYLVPASLTGSLNPLANDRSSSLPLLRVSSFRYRYFSGDICNLAVRVEQPSSGRVTDLGFSVLGTTFRGARQHWALRTWGQRIAMGSNVLEPGDPSLPAMGDAYR